MTATKKRKGIFLALPVLALLFLISTSMMSGTFAKYASTLSGADTALVAKWSFTGTNLGETEQTLPIWTHGFNNYINTSSPKIIAPGVNGQFNIVVTYNADVDAKVTINLTSTLSDVTALNVPLQYSLVDFDDDTNFNAATDIIYDLNSLENAITAELLNGTTVKDYGAANDNVFSVVGNGSDVNISIPVYWRWPHNATLDQNSPTEVAQKRDDAGFKGNTSNALVPSTAIHQWLDNDDTDIGKKSASLNRESYKLLVTIAAEQIAPTP